VQHILKCLFLCLRRVCLLSTHWYSNKTILDEHKPDKLTGSTDQSPWPQRSPNFTYLDLLLWGSVKDSVHVPCMKSNTEAILNK
jgi:hypothetical protein